MLLAGYGIYIVLGVILILIVFVTSLASIFTPVLSGAAIDAIPLRSSIVLNTDEEGNITHSELREINEGTEGLILALSKDNKWIINQEQTEVIGYKNDDKAFQSFIILEKGKALVYSENTKIETNATPKLEWVDNFVSSNTTNVYKIALGNSGVWEIYQLNPNLKHIFF